MKVGRELDISVPDVEIVFFEGQHAVLIQNFLELGESLREGSMLKSSTRESGRLALADVLDAMQIHLEANQAAACLTNMVCFDILIGNPDRHHENWGVIVPETKSGMPRPAPIYDNGSALGSNFDKQRIIKVLDDGWDPFDRGFRYEIEVREPRRPYIHELLAELRGIDPALAGFDGRLSRLTDETVNRIVSEVPDEVMGSEQRSFASELLKHRRDLILRS